MTIPDHPANSRRSSYVCDDETLRDRFAMQILAGMNASMITSTAWPDKDAAENMAAFAYIQADAMMKIRKL